MNLNEALNKYVRKLNEAGLSPEEQEMEKYVDTELEKPRYSSGMNFYNNRHLYWIGPNKYAGIKPEAIYAKVKDQVDCELRPNGLFYDADGVDIVKSVVDELSANVSDEDKAAFEQKRGGISPTARAATKFN